MNNNSNNKKDIKTLSLQIRDISNAVLYDIEKIRPRIQQQQQQQQTRRRRARARGTGSEQQQQQQQKQQKHSRYK